MHALSLIIPCYNKIKYLETCIESVMQQTRLPDEIILVDDCSSDGTRELIVELSEKYSRIKPLLLTKNSGVSAARNAGIMAATGDIISFMDSDDIIWGSTKFEKEMQLIEENPDKLLVYSITVVINEEGKKIKQEEIKKGALLSGSEKKADLLSGKYINQYIPRDYCVKRDILIQAGMFDETMKYYEDLDLLIRLTDYCEFKCSGVSGTGYRQVLGGLSDKNIENHKNTIAALRRRYFTELSPHEQILYYRLRLCCYISRAVRKLKGRGLQQ